MVWPHFSPDMIQGWEFLFSPLPSSVISWCIGDNVYTLLALRTILLPQQHVWLPASCSRSQRCNLEINSQNTGRFFWEKLPPRLSGRHLPPWVPSLPGGTTAAPHVLLGLQMQILLEDMMAEDALTTEEIKGMHRPTKTTLPS